MWKDHKCLVGYRCHLEIGTLHRKKSYVSYITVFDIRRKLDNRKNIILLSLIYMCVGGLSWNCVSSVNKVDGKGTSCPTLVSLEDYHIVTCNW